jgi:DNA modification methylase
MTQFTLYNDDCLNILRTMDDNSIDSCVTDPPYGLSFMGKSWDYDVPKVEIWKEVYRVLKPGAHLLAFFGSRTYHRGVVQIEDAGFEIRDQIMWIYGSGFPKSHNIGKAIDKEADVEREVVGEYKRKGRNNGILGKEVDVIRTITLPSTDSAKNWEGWGTALKPAHEPIVVARKPITQTVVKNVLEYGTGALNIDECRLDGRERTNYGLEKSVRSQKNTYGMPSISVNFDSNKGRWPANVIHDGSDEVVSRFPETKSGISVQRNGGGQKIGGGNGIYGGSKGLTREDVGYNDSGSAARFFYCAKASKSDRESNNNHPTVKPTDLMKYLCRLITPKNGIVLDPFMGSGSTGKAAISEGFKFVGIEINKEYFDIANMRIKNSIEKNLFDVFFESDEKVT